MNSSKLFISKHVIFYEHIFYCSFLNTILENSNASSNKGTLGNCLDSYSFPMTSASQMMSLTKSNYLTYSSPFSELNISSSITNHQIVDTPSSSSYHSHTLTQSPQSTPPTKHKSLNDIYTDCGVDLISLQKEHKPNVNLTTLSTKYPLSLCSNITLPYTIEPNDLNSVSKNPQWLQAMTPKFSALIKNNTWTLVPRSPNFHVIGCKWVFNLKYKLDGTIDKHKVRLVAKGFSQPEGFYETFSLVVKITSIPILLPLAISLN
ncbi:unnamed protein product [Spirodela intermedia]|uniref:Reverse transcriptase Ty1/copia-type domain-containing protein n=1 Tax=Spirodela intermedia TaxID=51605 RepID=A0A7I8LHW7_SPIIN|nr:unnamed protein product [Spirodela intermedia]